MARRSGATIGRRGHRTSLLPLLLAVGALVVLVAAGPTAVSAEQEKLPAASASSSKQPPTKPALEVVHPPEGPPGGPPSLVNIEAYPLVHVDGCAAAGGANASDLTLRPGLLDGACVVRMPPLPRDDPKVFVFTIPEGARMSVSLTLSVLGGSASMALWHPGVSIEDPPSQVQTELYASQATSEGFIALRPARLRPGQYLLAVSAFSGSPEATLRVVTTPASVVLAPRDRALLTEVATDCCANGANTTDNLFCQILAPRGIMGAHDWTDDLCHFAPNSCNARGQLTALMLPHIGLVCPSFPAQFGKLPALTRLDLSGNRMLAATVDDVAKGLQGSKRLAELALAAVGLAGTLSCDLSEALPALRLLDLSYNRIEGPLPACLLERRVEQLFVAGNALSGALPVPSPSGSRLVSLYSGRQRGTGFTGPVPRGLAALPSLKILTLGGSSLSGPLPPLARGMRVFNASGNAQLTGELAQVLPPGIWVLDVERTRLGGRLPPLGAYADLETFIANEAPLNGSSLLALPEGLEHLEVAGAGLVGALPRLPASLRRVDVSRNRLTGPIDALDLSRVEAFSAGENNLTGRVPPSATTARALWVLDLHDNRLDGPLPAQWSAPYLQMLMLEQNELTGPIPASLAKLPNLGVLRLGHNRLNGSLDAFASALTDPAELMAAFVAAANASEAATAAAAAAAGADPSAQPPFPPPPQLPSTAGVSRLFDFNVTHNELTGGVPPQLEFLGVFNPAATILVPGPNGEPEVAPRALALGGNKLSGEWPAWLLKAAPAAVRGCGCEFFVGLGKKPAGNGLRCPAAGQRLEVSAHAWQIASEQRWACNSGGALVPIIDFLAASGAAEDTDQGPGAWGDGATYGRRSGGKKLTPAGLAGLLVGVFAGVALITVAAYHLFAKRRLGLAGLGGGRAAERYAKHVDDDAAAAAAATLGGGGAVGVAPLVGSGAVAIASPAAAAAAAAPVGSSTADILAAQRSAATTTTAAL